MKDGKSADLISGYFASRPLRSIKDTTAELEALYLMDEIGEMKTVGSCNTYAAQECRTLPFSA